MKGRFFSGGIFREQFRQLKIVGIIGCVLYTLLGVFIPIGRGISGIKVIHDESGLFLEYASNVNSVYVCSVQLLIPMIFVPVLTLTAFHFLTKRSSSDFYHALPVKREAMYTGILAAVLVWALIITVLSVAVMWVMCLPMRSVDFMFSEALKAILNTFVSCLFMTGIMALGVNLSGTLFTNIISSGMVLVLPRIILVMCWVISGALVSYSVLDYHFVRLMLYGNPITKLIYVLASYDEDMFSAYFASGLTAGAIEGLIYTAAGCLFFKFRKSEAASLSSINRGVQSIMRHVLALVLSTIASVFLAKFVWYGHNEEFTIFMAVLFYVLAVVVYFLYELITTRKWKAVAKSVRQLPFFAGMTVAVFAAISIISLNGNNYRMNAENAEYIKVIGISRYWGEEYFLDEEDFPVEIKSPEYRKLIADAYNGGADGTRDGSEVGSIMVSVKENGFARKRYVYLNEKEMSGILGEIYGALKIDISQKLPDIKGYEDKYRIYIRWNIEEPCAFSSEEMRRVYDTLRREILESENPVEFLYKEWDRTLCMLELRGADNSDMVELPISAGLSKTMELVQDIIEEHNEVRDFAGMYERNLDKEGTDGVGVNGRIEFCPDNRNGVYYYSVFSYEDEDNGYTVVRLIYDILKKYNPDGDLSGENTVIENSDWYGGAYGVSFGVYNLSDDDMSRLWDIMQKQDQ